MANFAVERRYAMSAKRKKGKLKIVFDRPKVKVRAPLMPKRGGPHSPEKGKKGYNRRNEKKRWKKEDCHE